MAMKNGPMRQDIQEKIFFHPYSNPKQGKPLWRWDEKAGFSSQSE